MVVGLAASGAATQSFNQRLTPDELLVLPTAPKERTTEELNETDETDNWGAGKKSPIGGGFDRRERGERGGFFSDSQSRADDVDNWGANKSFVASDGRRGVGFESNGGADSENWLKKKEQEGQKFDSLRSRRGSNESMSNSESDTLGRKKEEFNGNGNGVAARPRLNLQPRTKPLEDGQQKGNGDDVVKPKGSNPFWEARPREEALKEKGQHWKEIDEKLEAVKIKESKEVVNSPDAKRGFGFSNGSGSSSSERAWTKPDTLDPRPSSSESSENGRVEEPRDGETQA
ncbi:translation initiation factor [Lithospermum erythrorhizon]|uniref:Translation initiation factor n=1 Tax=Lithospermum erythrorhizon TaxID=34254 RepID=A0AAV3R996_LITER